jgi:hypothetical protein
MCKDHPTKVLDGFCSTCQQVVCSVCIYKVHAKHDLNSIDEVINKLTNELNDFIDKKIKPLQFEIEKSINEIEQQTRNVKQESNVIQEIKKSFNEIRTMIDKRESILLSQLDSIVTSKISTLNQQRISLENILKESQLNIQQSITFLNSRNNVEIARSTPIMMKNLIQLHSQCSSQSKQPLEEANIECDVNNSNLSRIPFQFHILILSHFH